MADIKQSNIDSNRSEDTPLSPKVNAELFKLKDKILALRDKIKEQGRSGKRNIQKDWYRNILFLIGRQWITFDIQSKRWVDAPLPQWYEKPVTNKFASCHNTIKTVLTQKTPRIICKPATDADDDIATAEVADIVVDVTDAEADMKTFREIAATWKVSTGNVFAHSYYDINGSKYGEDFIQHEQCPSCGQMFSPDQIQVGDKVTQNPACPGCGAMNGFIPAMDPNGSPVGDTIEHGKLCIDAVPPFEMFFNQEVESWDKVTQCVRGKRVPVDDLKNLYPEIKDQLTGSAVGEHLEESILKALAYATNTGFPDVYFGTGSGQKVESETVDYLFSMPCEDYPNGLMATIIKNQIVELDELLYTRKTDDGRDQPFIPIRFGGSNRVSGRFWHRTFLDDVASKQIQRNKLESFILLWVYSMSGGKWLVPSGANMTKPDGQPNQMLQYDVTPTGQKPERMNGTPVDQVCVKLMELIDKDIEELSATYDVLKGQFPPGLDTFSGLRLLTERAFSRHNELIQNWERFNEEIKIQQIEIARKFFNHERKKTLQDELGAWETTTFTKEDIQGGLEIHIEEGSTIPTSKAVENAGIVDSIKLGLINVQNPKVNFKVLEKLGQSDLAPAVGEDIKDAAREWHEFLNIGKTRPRQGIDNDQIHLLDAISRAKSQEFFDLPDQAKALWIEHVQYHQANIAAAMAPPPGMMGAAKRPGGPTSPALEPPPTGQPAIPSVGMPQ